jgi:G3E family GTPase
MAKNIKDIQSSIPVVIITGFLGSGKTSFLSTILKLEELSKSAVIINEFGEYGLDHLLVEYSDSPIFELPNGCICCNARTDLIDKMLLLTSGRKHGTLDFDRIIIETTGVADTTNLIATLWNISAIRDEFQLSKIITVVSALEWPQIQSDFDEADSQLAISDAILISKSDLLPASTADQQLAHLKAAIGLVNDRADCFFLPLSPEQSCLLINDSETGSIPQPGSEDQHHNTATYKSCTLSHSAPVSISTIEAFMDIMLERYGGNLLRVKGQVLTVENPTRPLIVQAVKSTLSPFSWLKRWSIPPQTRITVIHNGKSNEIFTNLFNAMMDIPSIDQPDKTALSDNPLSIRGHGKF